MPNIGIPNNLKFRFPMVSEWSIRAMAIAMVLTILKPNHWKSEQNSGHLVWISNGLGQNGRHFVRNGTPLDLVTFSITFKLVLKRAFIQINFQLSSYVLYSEKLALKILIILKFVLFL